MKKVWLLILLASCKSGTSHESLSNNLIIRRWALDDSFQIKTGMSPKTVYHSSRLFGKDELMNSYTCFEDSLSPSYSISTRLDLKVEAQLYIPHFHEVSFLFLQSFFKDRPTYNRSIISISKNILATYEDDSLRERRYREVLSKYTK